MHEKERTSFHALTRSPTKGLNRMQKETMRPAGRIITYMPFCSQTSEEVEIFGRISLERRVALMLH